MNFTFLFALFSFTVFFIGIVYALYSFWRMRYSRIQLRINKRLDSFAGASSLTPVQLFNVVVYSKNHYLDERLKGLGWARYIQGSLSKLKWTMRCDQFILLTIGIGLFAIYFFHKLGAPNLLVLFFCLIFSAIPMAVMQIQLSQRQTQLEKQLPEVLDFISRAMQAGHTFIGSLQLAANEAKDPIASEFQRAFQEINFGRSVQSAMADLSARIDCPEMRYFAVAVFINQEIGGNLASLLNGVSSLIRERIKTKMALRAMTSEARASAWILSVLPFAVGGVMVLLRPDFIGILWRESAGRSMVGYAMVLMFFGVVWMQRMAKIRA